MIENEGRKVSSESCPYDEPYCSMCDLRGICEVFKND